MITRNGLRLGIAAALLVFSLSLLSAGCGGAAPKQEQKPAEEPKQAAPAEGPVMLRISSGTQGGLWQVYCTAWGNLLQQKIPNLKVQVESSGGGISNLVAVNDDKQVLGLTQNAVAYEGWNGLSWAKGKQYQNARSLFAVYPSISHFFAPEKTGIKTIYDLTGKVVSLGPAGGGIDVTARQLFEVLGVKPRQIINQNFTDMVQGMKDGMIHAGACAAGHPFSPLVELEQSMKMTHIEISEADRKRFLEKYPYYPVVRLDHKLYKYMDHDYDNITVYSYAICNKDMPEDLAYLITKITLENRNELEAAVKAAKDTLPENIQFVNLPLHPGALKYYKEKGISIPDAILPK